MFGGMENRDQVICVAVIPAGEKLDADPAAVRARGAASFAPPNVQDWDSLQQHVRSVHAIPEGSSYFLLREFEGDNMWFQAGQGALPDLSKWFVKVTLPNAAGSLPLTSILSSIGDKINGLNTKVSATLDEVSSTRSASKIKAEDFDLVLRALRIVGPLSEDINGNPIESEDVLAELLGNEDYWDERYEEQQREEYSKDVESWLSSKKSQRRIRWINGSRERVRCRFEGVHFTCSSKNDLVAVVRRFGQLFPQGAVLGVELKRKYITRKSLRQGLMKFLLWADASHLPFVQLVTNMKNGGVAYYCKTVDARPAIELRQVVLKNMEQVRAFVAKLGLAFPDDLGGDDERGNVLLHQTLNEPQRKKFRQIDRQGATNELWSVVPRILENEGDVANLADLQEFKLPAEVF